MEVKVILCELCGATKEEGLNEPCIDGSYHKFKSTEERRAGSRNHKERVRL